MADTRAEASKLQAKAQPSYNPTAFQQSALPSEPSERSELYLNLDCIDEAAAEAAYQYCRQSTKVGSKTFYMGSLLLPYHKRRAMWAVYNFCRVTDDMVDNARDVELEQLQARLRDWEDQLQRSFEGQVQSHLPHMVAWTHAVHRFKIPPTPPLELIAGVRMDLDKVRYQNFEELRLYCYRVASTVGLMASEVIGYSDPCALDYAVNLGIAMQLTNILRDVGEDLRNGRIYLPLEEMEQFEYSEAELLRGEINPRFIRLMQFQIDRARHYYSLAMPGIEYLDKDCRLSITVAARLYSRILDMIERNGYDVFTRRAFVPKGQKLQGLAKAWVGRSLRRVPKP